MRRKFKIYLVLLICFSTYIVSRHVLPLLRSQFTNDLPKVILVLGGDIEREIAGIRISKELNLPVIISGGSNAQFSDWLIRGEGISKDLVKRDYRAKDTLTNFTSIIDDLSQEGVSHILLITSNYHIDRAKLIGEIITSSRGIRLTSLSIQCKSLCKEKAQKETKRKKNIDFLRSIIWVTTGRDIKSLVPNFLKYHFGGSKV